MTTYLRYLAIAAIPIFLGLSAPGMAMDSPATVQAAKACTKQCGDKYGTGMHKGEKKYDAGRYESCMNECMSNVRSSSGSSARKYK